MGDTLSGEAQSSEQHSGSEPSEIFVGAYHDGRYVQAGTFVPQRGEVRVSARGGPDPTVWVSPEGWIDIFSLRHAVNSRAETAFKLFRDGGLREQPQCAECGDHVHPRWVQRSEDVPEDVADEILCKTHLKRLYDEEYDSLWIIYPWQDLEDIREHVEEMGVGSFEDPGGVLDPLR